MIEMKLRVKDIVKIWNNGAASLVAGQEGAALINIRIILSTFVRK